MKLFHSPGACSLGIRVLMEEIGAPFETVIVDLKSGEHRQPAYMKLNPKAKVPALLRPDGRLLTEFPVIALWLARQFPEKNLLPDGPEGDIDALELLDYVVSTLHMRGATLAMRPDRFCQDPKGQEEVRKSGCEVLTVGFERLEEQLGEKEWFFGHMTIVDMAVFYLVHWQPRYDLPLPPRLKAFHERMMERPAVKRALA